MHYVPDTHTAVELGGTRALGLTQDYSPRAEIARLLREAADGRALIKVETAVQLLGLSRTAGFRAAKNGSLPTIAFNGRRYVAVVALEKIMLGERSS